MLKRFPVGPLLCGIHSLVLFSRLHLAHVGGYCCHEVGVRLLLGQLLLGRDAVGASVRLLVLEESCQGAIRLSAAQIITSL